jgi:hypothetical protein
MKKFILFFTALTVAASFCAHAQVTVTTRTGVSPWNDLGYASTTKTFTGKATDFGGGVVAKEFMQQTFTVSEEFSAKAFHIRFKNPGVEEGKVRIAVYKVADPNQADPLAPGTELFSAGDLMIPVADNTSIAIFTLDKPLALKAGSYVLQISTAAATDLEWRRTGKGHETPYPGGRAYASGITSGGGTTFKKGEMDFALAITATPTATP